MGIDVWSYIVYLSKVSLLVLKFDTQNLKCVSFTERRWTIWNRGKESSEKERDVREWKWY